MPKIATTDGERGRVGSNDGMTVARSTRRHGNANDKHDADICKERHAEPLQVRHVPRGTE